MHTGIDIFGNMAIAIRQTSPSTMYRLSVGAWLVVRPLLARCGHTTPRFSWLSRHYRNLNLPACLSPPTASQHPFSSSPSICLPACPLPTNWQPTPFSSSRSMRRTPQRQLGSHFQQNSWFTATSMDSVAGAGNVAAGKAVQRDLAHATTRSRAPRVTAALALSLPLISIAGRAQPASHSHRPPPRGRMPRF